MRKELKKKARSFAIMNALDKSPIWIGESIVDMICDYYEKDTITEFEDYCFLGQGVGDRQINIPTVLNSDFRLLDYYGFKLKVDKKYKIIIKEVE